MNSTMGSIFNIFKYMNSACTVRKQYMHCSWTVNFVSESQHKWLERKKKKKEKKRPDARRRRTIQTAPIYGLDYYWLRLRLGPAFVSAFAFFCSFFSFSFFTRFGTKFTVMAIVHALCMNSSRKVWLVKQFSTNQCTPYTVHGPTNFTFQQLFY